VPDRAYERRFFAGLVCAGGHPTTHPVAQARRRLLRGLGDDLLDNLRMCCHLPKAMNGRRIKRKQISLIPFKLI